MATCGRNGTLVTVNGRLDFSSGRFFGNVLMIGSMLSWVIYTFINEQLDKKYPIMTIITYQSLASIFLFIPLVTPEMGKWPAPTSLSMSTVANLIFLGVFCSALEYVFYTYAVRGLGTTVSIAFLNLIPVVTVISGYLILHETIQNIELIGICVIMASIYWLNKIVPKTDENVLRSKQAIAKPSVLGDNSGSSK